MEKRDREEHKDAGNPAEDRPRGDQVGPAGAAAASKQGQTEVDPYEQELPPERLQAAVERLDQLSKALIENPEGLLGAALADRLFGARDNTPAQQRDVIIALIRSEQEKGAISEAEAQGVLTSCNDPTLLPAAANQIMLRRLAELRPEYRDAIDRLPSGHVR